MAAADIPPVRAPARVQLVAAAGWGVVLPGHSDVRQRLPPQPPTPPTSCPVPVEESPVKAEALAAGLSAAAAGAAYPIKYYSSVSGGLRETKTAI